MKERRLNFIAVDIGKLEKYGFDKDGIKSAMARIIQFDNEDGTYSQRLDVLCTKEDGTQVYLKHRIETFAEEFEIRTDFRFIPTIYR